MPPPPLIFQNIYQIGIKFLHKLYVVKNRKKKAWKYHKNKQNIKFLAEVFKDKFRKQKLKYDNIMLFCYQV